MQIKQADSIKSLKVIPVPGRILSVKKRFVKSWQLYILLLPAIVYFTIFHYVPMYGVQIAFKDYIATLGITGSPWIGFDHFIRFYNSYYFWRILKYICD